MAGILAGASRVCARALPARGPAALNPRRAHPTLACVSRGYRFVAPAP